MNKILIVPGLLVVYGPSLRIELWGNFYDRTGNSVVCAAVSLNCSNCILCILKYRPKFWVSLVVKKREPNNEY